ASRKRCGHAPSSEKNRRWNRGPPASDAPTSDPWVEPPGHPARWGRDPHCLRSLSAGSLGNRGAPDRLPDDTKSEGPTPLFPWGRRMTPEIPTPAAGPESTL